MSLEVQSSSLLPQMGSQPDRFTMYPFVMSIVISFKVQKRFERFTHLGHSRFSSAVDKNSYEFLIDFQESCIIYIFLGLMELIIPPIN